MARLELEPEELIEIAKSWVHPDKSTKGLCVSNQGKTAIRKSSQSKEKYIHPRYIFESNLKKEFSGLRDFIKRPLMNTSLDDHRDARHEMKRLEKSILHYTKPRFYYCDHSMENPAEPGTCDYCGEELEEGEELFCMACGRTTTERVLHREPTFTVLGELDRTRLEWHFHHVEESGYKRPSSGWDSYYRARDDFEDGVEIWVVGRKCHKQIHRERGDLGQAFSSY